MDISKIEILLRAIELGSMSKASNEFLYTPSAVSHILDSIENEVGVKFIRRTYAGIEIESGYEEIVENLRQIVDIQKRTRQIAFDIHQKKKSLTIATYASLSKYILAKVIRGFNKRFPDIHINILVDENMKRVYKNGGADILFGEEVDGGNICWESLLTDPYIAVFPKQYNFSGDCISLEELYKLTFIKVNDSKISKYIDEGKFLDIVHIDSHDDSSVIYMVKEEVGVAILPMLSVYDEKDVKCVKLESEIQRMLGIIYNKRDFQKKKELRDFVEYVRTFDFEQFRETIPQSAMQKTLANAEEIKL